MTPFIDAILPDTILPDASRSNARRSNAIRSNTGHSNTGHSTTGRRPQSRRRTQQSKVLHSNVWLTKIRLPNIKKYSLIPRLSRILLSFLFAGKRFTQLDAGKALVHNTTLYICTAIWIFLYAWMAMRLWQQPIFTLDRSTLVQGALCILLGVYVVLGWRSTTRNWRARFAWLSPQKWFQRLGKTAKWHPLTQQEMSVMDPGDFEAYVAECIFERMGYDVLDTPNVKDGGIDILLEDEYGAQSVVQCKRYSSTVGTPVVRDLYGTMIHSGAVYGYLVTSGRISRDAHEWSSDKPIGLIDGAEVERLARVLMAPK